MHISYTKLNSVLCANNTLFEFESVFIKSNENQKHGGIFFEIYYYLHPKEV